MHGCDRCGKVDQDQKHYLNVAVEFTVGGDGPRDERKLEASVCPSCFEAIERTLTGILRARSVFPPAGEYASRPTFQSTAERALPKAAAAVPDGGR